jgi:uncharacterized protein YndB with AHSA1/START domain
MSEAGTRNQTTVTRQSETEVRIERVFEASRELVWEAYTDPRLLCQWLGPRRMRMTVQELDLRPGGRYRYTHQGEQPGSEGPFVFFGEFREVEPPRLLVQTFQFEGNEHGESVDRLELEALEADRTQLLVTATFPSTEALDAILAAGMERGVREGYEKLDELLASRRG